MSEHENDRSTNSATNVSSGETVRIAQKFEPFEPSIKSILKLGEEIVTLYKKARHNKELCSFLLERCNCAMASIKDLDMRKTEHVEFFSEENLKLLGGFERCLKTMKDFILRVSKLYQLIKYLRVENDLKLLVKELDEYMMRLNFSFTVRSDDTSIKIQDYLIQINELLFYVYGISGVKKSQQNFFDRLNSVNEKKKELQNQDQSDESNINEPLLNGIDYHRTNIPPESKSVEKRISKVDSTDVCFREFSNKIISDDSDDLDAQTENRTQVDTQIEIRRQVNILKLLRDSDHIVRFIGVAQEGVAQDDSKFYLVTEWMDNGNLCEYYTKHKEKMNWETKIRFALDICRGVAYLHEFEILHHDIRPKNILVSKDHKVKIANFDFSRKFSDVTRSVGHDSKNIRYMAPEKLLLKKDDEKLYDHKCEIYSIGVTLWEIGELKEPFNDLDKIDIKDDIRKRMMDTVYEPFSNDAPSEWQNLVSRAMEYNSDLRSNLSDICRDFYKLNEKYSGSKPFLTVVDAISEHKSKNVDRLLVWNSLKFHSITNVEAKYWLGYYYFYHGEDIPELQLINKEERNKIAIDIYKETADRGNPSAQFRYGMHLWGKENYNEAFRYLKMSADANNDPAMYIVGKVYWNGNKDIEQDKVKGTEYLTRAALKDNAKAKEMCNANNISYHS